MNLRDSKPLQTIRPKSNYINFTVENLSNPID